MQGISLTAEAVQTALQRVRADVLEPYEQLRVKTQQLRNLHSTIELLRHVISRLKLTQKLKQQLNSDQPGALDLAKAAKLLSDIAAVDQEADLSDVEVVQADAEFLRTASRTVAWQAEVLSLQFVKVSAHTGNSSPQ